MLLPLLLLDVVSCQAGLLFSEVPITSSSTNVHSPSAISHQSITHIHTNDHQAVHKPAALLLSKSSLHKYHQESESLGSVVFPSEAIGETETFALSDEHSKGGSPETSSPYISYKDNTPVFTSHTHTPAHLTYAAHPIVYKMLPQLKAAPYRSYETFLTSPRVKIYN